MKCKKVTLGTSGIKAVEMVESNHNQRVCLVLMDWLPLELRPNQFRNEPFIIVMCDPDDEIIDGWSGENSEAEVEMNWISDPVYKWRDPILPWMDEPDGHHKRGYIKIDGELIKTWDEYIPKL